MTTTPPGGAPRGNKKLNRPGEGGFFSGAGVRFRRALAADLDGGVLLADEAPLAPGPDAPQGEWAFFKLRVWRRAVLWLALVALVPMLVVNLVSTIVDMADSDFGDLRVDPDALSAMNALSLLLLALDVGLAVGVLTAYRRWASWRRSRRVLFWTWLLAFAGPFVTALFPARALAGGGNEGAQMLIGLLGATLVFAELAPKAISLIPGLLRAAVSAKVLFPRSGAPGWLIRLAAPFYLLLVFVVMLVPYQVSGSPLFVVALLAFCAAPVWLWRSGGALAKPTSLEDAVAAVRRTRLVQGLLNGVGLVFLVAGVVSSPLPVGPLKVVELVLGLGANVLVLSVVGLDALVAAMLTQHDLDGTELERDGTILQKHAMTEFAAAAGDEPPSGPATPAAPETGPGDGT
ncbi:MAG: hypothetical protein H6745_09575 [Deltaproteobacteria bacterium]|nr:hypothetical protein [Deltaproteobacteria bacterium]